MVRRQALWSGAPAFGNQASGSLPPETRSPNFLIKSQLIYQQI
jgi:hypothetical protein